MALCSVFHFNCSHAKFSLHFKFKLYKYSLFVCDFKFTYTNRNRKRIGNCFLSSIFWIQWHWTKWRYWRVALKVSPPVTNYKHWKRLWHFCCCCCCYFRPFCAEALAAGFSFCVKQSQALCPFFKSLSGPSLIGTQVCQCEQDGHVTYQHHCSGTVCVMHQENKLSLMKSWCYLSVL